jgi:hypothetical protein
LRWLGFSYIAFRLIHVLRDKQLGRLPELSLAEFGTYVVFFPSLAAGPIDRAERFARTCERNFCLTRTKLCWPASVLVLGLFKKFVIADTLALIALNDALATQVRTAGWMWIIVYAYAFQIYFDFSGYTDIAIGIARLVASNYLKTLPRPVYQTQPDPVLEQLAHDAHPVDPLLFFQPASTAGYAAINPARMDNDPRRPGRDNAGHRLVARRDGQLHLLGSLAWSWDSSSRTVGVIL